MGLREEIPGSDVACESIDIRGDVSVGGSLVVSGTPITGAGGTAGLFGTGPDGNLDFDGVTPVASALGGTLAFNLVPAAGVYTLTRDVYAANMTVAPGVRITTDGWRIFVSGTLTHNGAISCNGGNGGNGIAIAGGAAGAPRPTQLLYGGRLGTAGTAPTATGAAGMVPANTHMGAGTALVAGGANGGVMQGGGGGHNELAGPGFDGGTVAASPNGGAVNAPTFQALGQALTGRNLSLAQQETASSGAVGRPGSTPGTGGSGGSGASGGTVIVCANIIAGAGSIEATGGNAGLAGGVDSGGSGGGGGGAVLVVTKSQAPLTITTNVSGGIGSPAGGSPNTTAGGNGGPGLAYVFAGV